MYIGHTSFSSNGSWSRSSTKIFNNRIFTCIPNFIFTLTLELLNHWLLGQFIELIGPSVNYLTIRFEGKNRENKQTTVSLACQNNVNEKPLKISSFKVWWKYSNLNFDNVKILVVEVIVQFLILADSHQVPGKIWLHHRVQQIILPRKIYTGNFF